MNPNTCNGIGSLPYLYGNKQDHLQLVVPLYQAASRGDWETAKIIFKKRPELVRSGISKNLDTALHVAATAKWTTKNVNFVKNLVDMMTVEELEIKNKLSNTAFWEVAAFGKLEVAKIMLEKNPNLLNIRGSDGLLPLSVATLTKKELTVRYLYSSSRKMSGDHWTESDRDLTLIHCVKSYLFDVAHQILEDRPELARNVSLLEVLARTPQAYYKVGYDLTGLRRYGVKVPHLHHGPALKLLKIIWGHATRTMDIDEIEDIVRRPSRVLFIAAERGNTEFVVELLHTYPHLMLDTNEDGLTIFHVAVLHRRVGIYSLLYDVGGSCRNNILVLKDKSDNNMLHLVGKTSRIMAAKTPRASLLMQRETLWFIEVVQMMPPYLRKAKNKEGQTPSELFLKETAGQVSKGLKWTKDCMVVATLIVTVAFAVAFTVPGGYNQEHGLPIFNHQPTFLVFVIADAISLFASSTSLLVFLSILTSRHQHDDFLVTLPRKLMLGLLTLFISLAAVMVTFSASFFVLYHRGLRWVPILIATSATLPVIWFAQLQLPLLMDMFRILTICFGPRNVCSRSHKIEVMF